MVSQEDLTEIRRVETESEGIVVYELPDETVSVSDGEVEFFETEDGFVFLTTEDWYFVEQCEDGWATPSGDEPRSVRKKMDELNMSYGDVNFDGYPVEFTVSYRSEGAIFDTLWREEILRPSSAVEETFYNVITEVFLTVQLHEDHSLEVVDVETWPENSNVSVSI